MKPIFFFRNLTGGLIRFHQISKINRTNHTNGTVNFDTLDGLRFYCIGMENIFWELNHELSK
ncbi:MAG: hypothetical protein AABY22_19955 [Nanoarchaeota archaeon]